jgi:hypothetical protein
MKRTNAVLYIIAGVCMLLGHKIYAEESMKITKKKIAVLEINTNNAPLSLGNIARNSFEVFLFNSDRFQLLDREQLQNIAQQTGISPNSAVSSPELVKLGEKLSVDFLICGNIDKLDDYKLTIRVISVEKGEIITVHSKRFSSPENIDGILDLLTDKTTQDIVTYAEKGMVRKPFFEDHTVYSGFSVNYIFPLSGMKDLVNSGPGGNIRLEANNIITDASFAGVSLGYYRFTGKKNSQDEASFLLSQLSFGCRYFFTKRLYGKGSVDGGINLVTLSHKGSTGFTMAENSQKTSLEPVVQCGMYAGLIPGYNINLELGASYGVIFEKDGTLSFMNASVNFYVTF